MNREEVYGAEATLGLPLEEFIAISIAGFQQVAPETGLQSGAGVRTASELRLSTRSWCDGGPRIVHSW